MKIILGDILNQRAMTQKEFARISGVSEAHISDIVNGVKSPTADILCRLANALDVEIGDIVRCRE